VFHFSCCFSGFVSQFCSQLMWIMSMWSCWICALIWALILLSRSPVLAKDQCRNLPPLRDFGVRWVRPEKLAHSVVSLPLF